MPKNLLKEIANINAESCCKGVLHHPSTQADFLKCRHYGSYYKSVLEHDVKLKLGFATKTIF